MMVSGFLKTIIENRYFSDIVEASNGFFLLVADEINLHDITNLTKAAPYLKFKVCERFGIPQDGKTTREIDKYFLKYGKYNQYEIKDEVANYIKIPKIKNIINIYGNDKIINCDLVMEVAIDTNNMLSNLFYKVLNPYMEFMTIEKEEENQKFITYYIKVSFAVDEIFKNFKIIDVVRSEPEARIPKDGIKYTIDLVPEIKQKDLQVFTDRMIKKYDMHIPIDTEKIVEKMGMTVTDAFNLKKNNRVQGMVCISSGEVKLMEGNLSVNEGTILIDKNLKEKSIGSYRFTILHECVHYELHKYYLTLRKQVNNLRDTKYANSNHKIAITDDIVKNDNKFSNESIVEWQANSIAARILVPSDVLTQKLFEKYIEHNYFTIENKEYILKKIAFEIAKYFKVSRELMCIRIKQEKIFTYDIDLAPLKTNILYKDEMKELYNTDKTFKNLIDSKKIIYKNNRCIVKDKNTIEDVGITFFGYSSNNKSMLYFKKDGDDITRGDDTLTFIRARKYLEYKKAV